jgi:hypothetical protein
MMDKKEDPLERKESVVALYLMGNTPERISEKLAMPAKNVRKDLRSMGIKVIEDNSKTEEQIIIEVRQEIELAKQELWNMYVRTKNTNEKLNIIAHLCELISKKTDTVRKTSVNYVPRYSNSDKSLWEDVKENFFTQKKAFAESVKAETVKVPMKLESVKELPRAVNLSAAKIEIIDLPKQTSCIKFAEPKRLPEREKPSGEEVPTKGYIYSPGFNSECEKDNEKLEIIDWSEHLEGILKEVKKLPRPEKKDRTIENKIAEFEKNRKAK